MKRARPEISGQLELSVFDGPDADSPQDWTRTEAELTEQENQQ